MTAARTAVVVLLAAALAFIGGWLLRPSPPEPSAVDVGFCQDMAVHHAQATLMAQLAMDFSRTPAVRAIARQILITQSEERGTLTGWLTTWKKPQLPSGPPMSWMPGHQHARTMPGMATQRELDGLAGAEGQAFDTRFLRLMVRHHAGGIQMAQAARDRARLPEVRAFAGAMVIHQTEENAVLRQLLTR